MLSPEYLRKVADSAENIASQLDEYITRQIVKRIMTRLGRGEDYILTQTDVWQVVTLQQSGLLLEEVTAAIVKYTNLEETELKRAMEETGIEALKNDDAIYAAAGIATTPLKQSPEMLRLMERNYNATLGTMQNFTRTTARRAQKLFVEQSDLAYNKVMSGAVPYTQAVKEALKTIIDTGTTVNVEYPTGHVDTIETATARAVRTGVSQAASEISLKRMEETEWDIVLVSAHVGARTGDGGNNPGNHYSWQGKYYSKSGNDKRFPPFVETTGYGTGEGLSGWNCRHSFGCGTGLDEDNPYKEIDSEENKRVEKLNQKQRKMEREIRKTKRKVACLQDAVDVCTDEELKTDLQLELDKESAKLTRQNQAYNDYCMDNNLKPAKERTQIAEWNRKRAAKATAAARRHNKNVKGNKQP